MTERIRIPNGWTPRKYQMPLWRYLENGGRRAIDIAHRRWGKDDVALHWGCVAAHQRPATYWHMLPQATQARKAIWEAVNPHSGIRRIDEAFPVALRDTTREQEMMIRLKTGATWQVVGSDNFNSLVGSPPAGIVFSEFALANPYSWAYLKPILDENGGWAIFITTPRGRNHAHKMYEAAKRDPSWFAERSSALDTGRFTRKQLDEFKKEYIDLFGEDMGSAMFEQEYLCSFDAAILGAYYGKEIAEAEREGRICSVAHDASLPVFTAWDLGHSDDTSIWFFQVHWGEIRIIDHYRAAGQDLHHYAEVLCGRRIIVTERGDKGEPKKWVHGEPVPEHSHRIAYRYGRHWGPHDARPKTLAANGRSIVQQLDDYGVRMAIVPQLSVQDGIQSARSTLKHCWFDETRCAYGLDSLKNYRREWDEDKRMFKESPEHDWTSHAADAFRYLSLIWKNPESEKPIEKPRFLHDLTANEVFWPKEHVNAHERERI
jgi:phage terminase large subunit